MQHAPASQQEPPEEENYFVSLSDLMTGVVFLFVILLCAFAFHYQASESEAAKARRAAELAHEDAKDKGLKAEQAAGAAKEATEDAKAKGQQIDALGTLLKEHDQALRGTLVQLASRLAKEGVRVTVDEANGVLRLPDDFLFESGSAELNDEGKAGVSVLASRLIPILRQGCEAGTAFRLEAVFIEGHTDNKPVRSSRFADNWDLSTARATGTYRALIAAEPALDGFRNPADRPVLGVSGYGENRPVGDNTTEEGRARNRRIDLRFLIAYPSSEEIRKRLDSILKASTKTSAGR